MAEAPKRIWLKRITDAGDEWWELSDADTGGPAYVRADIADGYREALKEALDAEEYANPKYLADDHWTKRAHVLLFDGGDEA